MKKNVQWMLAAILFGGLALTSCSRNDNPSGPSTPEGPTEPDPVVTIVDFENVDEEAPIAPFTIADETKMTAEIVADEDNGTNVVKFTRSGSSGFGFASIDLSEEFENATQVKVSFDFNIPAEILGQSAIALGDAAVHNAAAGGFNTTSGQYGYGTNGAIFYMGAYRGKAYGGGNENYFQINGLPAAASQEEHLAADMWGKWFHIDLDVNVANKTVNYTIKQGEEIWWENNGDTLAFVSDAAETCTQLSLYVGYSGSYLLDNIKVEKAAFDENIKYADYTVSWVTTEGTAVPEELKTSVTRRGKVGSAIALLPADIANFQNADGSIKYIYDSDNSATSVITEAGTEIKVVFKVEEAATYKYLLNVFAGTGSTTADLLVRFQGEEFEGVSTKLRPSVCYKHTDGAYYTIAPDSYNGKVITFTGEEEKRSGYVISTLNYTKDESIVYFSEAENLPVVGETINGFSNPAFDRMSGGISLRLADGSYFTTTEEIPAGTYTIAFYGRSDSGTSGPVSIYTINADGSETKLEVTASPETFASAGMGWFTFEGVTIANAAKLKFVNESGTTGFAYDVVKITKPAAAE